jgi:ATP-binding cassette subfamily B (MDR/TAP) protein 1
MTLFTQALMNYAGAWLIQRGEMTFEQMLQVYMLILFTVAYTTQVLGFRELCPGYPSS